MTNNILTQGCYNYDLLVANVCVIYVTDLKFSLKFNTAAYMFDYKCSFYMLLVCVCVCVDVLLYV